MTNLSLLKVFALEYDGLTNSILPNIRYLNPKRLFDDMYKILNCSTITCTVVEINNTTFDIWSDDEALLVDYPVPVMYVNDDLVIFGNMLFAKSDNEGNIIGLRDSEPQMLYAYALSQYPKLVRWIQNLKAGEPDA